MILENQVVSLELAKKLKELGVKQESYFSWVISKDKEKRDIVQLRRTDIGVYNNPLYKMYHAYSVAELGDILPKNVAFPSPQREGKGWVWRNEIGNNFVITEANARASLLIHLLENKFITL